jgi:hypothetical protein
MRSRRQILLQPASPTSHPISEHVPALQLAANLTLPDDQVTVDEANNPPVLIEPERPRGSIHGVTEEEAINPPVFREPEPPRHRNLSRPLAALHTCNSHEEVQDLVGQYYRGNKGVVCPFCGKEYKHKKNIGRHLKEIRCETIKTVLKGIDGAINSSYAPSETDESISSAQSIEKGIDGAKKSSYAPSETDKSISSARSIEAYERIPVPVTLEVTDAGNEILTCLQQVPHIQVPGFIHQFHPNWTPKTEINNELAVKLLVKNDVHQQFKVFTVSHFLSRLFALTEAKRILSSSSLEQDFDSAGEKKAMKENKARFWAMVYE